MITNRTTPTTPIPFDYGQLDPAVRADVEGATRRIHDLERRTSESIIEIGRTLIEVKERAGHGHFGAWLEAEFGWSDQTALNFMNVARRFGDNPKILESASPSALYALASESTPDEVRVEFTELAQIGAQVRHKDVKEAIEQHRTVRVRPPENSTPDPQTIRVSYPERSTPEPRMIRVIHPPTPADDDEYPEVPSEVVDLSPGEILVAGALRQEPAIDHDDDEDYFPDSTPEERQAVVTALHALLRARQRPDGERVTLTEAIEHIAAHADVDTQKWVLAELVDLRTGMLMDFDLGPLRRAIHAHR